MRLAKHVLSSGTNRKPRVERGHFGTNQCRRKNLAVINIENNFTETLIGKSSSHCGGPGTVSEQLAWYLRWTDWHQNEFSSELFGILLPVSFHQCAIFTRIPDGWTTGPSAVTFHRNAALQLLSNKITATVTQNSTSLKRFLADCRVYVFLYITTLAKDPQLILLTDRTIKAVVGIIQKYLKSFITFQTILIAGLNKAVVVAFSLNAVSLYRRKQLIQRSHFCETKTKFNRKCRG